MYENLTTSSSFFQSIFMCSTQICLSKNPIEFIFICVTVWTSEVVFPPNNFRQTISYLSSTHTDTSSGLLKLTHNDTFPCLWAHTFTVVNMLFLLVTVLLGTFFYIIQNLILRKLININAINDLIIHSLIFFKNYNNNYRPIFHLESFTLYLIELANENKWCYCYFKYTKL